MFFSGANNHAQAEIRGLRNQARTDEEAHKRTVVELNETLTTRLAQQQEAHAAELARLRQEWGTETEAAHARELKSVNDRFQTQLAAGNSHRNRHPHP
eukprot:COSAG05_NODE_504_length_9208_cov_22.420024_4_plen_98_part_00